MIMRARIFLYNARIFKFIKALQASKTRRTPVGRTPATCYPSVHILIHSFLHSFSSLSSQGSQQVHIILADAALRLTQLLDSLTRMQHGRMVATAECVADL